MTKKSDRYIQRILDFPVVKAALSLSKRIVLPGFDGMPVYDVANFFIKGLQKGAINMRAASLSFSFFMAIFPGILFFFTLLPYIPIHNLNEQVLSLLSTLLPQHAVETVKGTIEDITLNKRGGLLSFGFLFALYFSTNGIMSIIQAFNNTYHTIETRNFIIQRLMAIVLVIILSVLVLSAIALITFGNTTINFLVESNILKDQFTYYLLIIIKWLAITLMIFFGISFLYYLAPAKKSRYRFISAGSTLAALATVVTCILFNWYVNNLSRYNALYGSIGTLLILLLWIYSNANILLIGFELNASISSAKQVQNNQEDL